MRKNKLLFATGIIILLLILTNITATAYSHGLENSQNNPLNVNLLPDQIYENAKRMGTDWYYKPSNYAELVNWYQALETAYPNYLEIFKANELYGTGQSTGGYDLYYVRITNESLGLHKPEVVFQGGPHGDETVGKIGLYWFTDWLMRMAFTDEPSPLYSKNYLRWLIDNREIYFVVDHNPYGFDHGPQRYDGNGWDINREYDYDGPGTPTGGIWGSENGKTFRKFVDSHLLMLGCDFHGGVRMLIYPWADTFASVSGTSPISGTTYSHAPPDFYYYDAVGLRLGDFMGDYGGDFNNGNVGPIRDLLWYSIKGGSAPWAYAADVIANPSQDPYVDDETFGNYPGAGMLWISPEMSTTKNPPESTFGNDTVHRYGAEVRRFVLHQADLAEPYVRWQSGTIENNTLLFPEDILNFSWQVNGSMVVDHTYIQYSTDPDPINNPEYVTTDHDQYAGEYIGGTGWDNALNGQTNGVTYSESFNIETPGEYYFVAKAQVDQVYANVLRPDIYDDTPYLRMIKQRTNDSYYEFLQGIDGLEEVIGQTWWYSPIIHVTVIPETGSPNKPTINGPIFGKPNNEYTYEFTASDPENENVFYYIDWGDGTYEDWVGPYPSGETIEVTHQWTNLGDYEIKAKAKDINGARGLWSEPYPMHIGMPSLDIDPITGGLLNVDTIIKNIGDAEATDVQWRITLIGGLILLGGETSGEIAYIPPGGEETINSNLIIGFGKTLVSTTVEIPEGSDTRQQTGNVFLFFIKISPGGGLQ
ncbi:MAG: hypothetical protein JSW06_06855 [Thermoplasmatales archaeon]|nr:MAG: hypothetical protein JSW06_06855 [Thermoplasmatales archaeon]